MGKLLFFTVSLFVCTYINAQSPSLVDIYFNDTLADVAHGNSFQNHGSLLFTDDRDSFDRCAGRFNNQDGGYLQLNTSNLYSDISGLTVSCWIRYNSLNWESNQQFFIELRTEQPDNLARSEIHNVSLMAFDLYTPVVNVRYSDQQSDWEAFWDLDWNSNYHQYLDTTTWYHLAFTIDSMNVIKYYRNDSLYSTDTLSKDIFGYEWSDVNTYFGRFYKGSLDNIKIFSRALTEDQIHELYNEESECSDMTSTNQIVLSNVRLYPNPFKNKLKYTFPGEQCFSVSLHNVDGMTVYHQKGLRAEGSLNLGSLSSGIYFLKIINEDSQVLKVSKVIKY